MSRQSVCGVVLLRAGIAFHPRLPAETQQAVERMGIGQVEKLFFEFDDM